MYHRGLGFEETFGDAVDSSGPADLVQTAYGYTADWDWHQWALVLVAGWFVLNRVVGGVKATGSAISGRARKVKGKGRKAREAVAGFTPFSFLGPEKSYRRRR